MSCRKFYTPRHGSLQYVPKRRAKSMKSSIRAYPKDDQSNPCHLTGFVSYKAGMTHVVRSMEVRFKNKVINKEVVDAVTILETPPMVCHGIVGYRRGISGLERTKVLLADNLEENVIRRMFVQKYVKNVEYEDKRKSPGFTEEDIEELVNTSEIIRMLCNTQPDKIKSLKTKKAHITEIQVNGGSIQEKVNFALERFEQEISISDVFNKGEMIDTMGVTKGKGFQGVVKRYGVTILPRKTNKGTRKVACIGPWHPSGVMFSVARAGQLGCHRRTQQNLRVYSIGNGLEPLQTEFDLTVKTVNPLGGFVKYGYVKNDFIMVKGCVTGPCKRAITLRKTLHPRSVKEASIKFIDTSSKIGKGRFQTSEEKRAFYGISKPEVNNSN